MENMNEEYAAFFTPQGQLTSNSTSGSAETFHFKRMHIFGI